MQEELGIILAPIDLNPHWYMPNDRPHGKTWVRAVFLSFHGSCAAIGSPDPLRVQNGLVNLAESAVSAGVVLPYSEMDCDRLRSLLAEQEAPDRGEDRRMGIAMGRLVAHELYHVLLQTTAHSATGIAQAVCTPGSLLARSFHFEAGELERIQVKYALAPRLHITAEARVKSVNPQKTSFRAN
jgi:hypothetical protein